jgi:hypothetical protein
VSLSARTLGEAASAHLDPQCSASARRGLRFSFSQSTTNPPAEQVSVLADQGATSRGFVFWQVPLTWSNRRNDGQVRRHVQHLSHTCFFLCFHSLDNIKGCSLSQFLAFLGAMSRNKHKFAFCRSRAKRRKISLSVSISYLAPSPKQYYFLLPYLHANFYEELGYEYSSSNIGLKSYRSIFLIHNIFLLVLKVIHYFVAANTKRIRL